MKNTRNFLVGLRNINDYSKETSLNDPKLTKIPNNDKYKYFQICIVAVLKLHPQESKDEAETLVSVCDDSDACALICFLNVNFLQQHYSRALDMILPEHQPHKSKTRLSGS